MPGFQFKGPGLQAKQLTASVGCEILSVEPSTPIEFTPISMLVRVSNPPAEPFPGNVRYTGQLSPAGPGFTQVNLPAGPGITGAMAGVPVPVTTVRLFGLAPAAGQNVPLKVELFRDAVGEFPPPIATASIELNIVANYQFEINEIRCLNPRATYNDTLKGSCRILFGDQPLALYRPDSPLDLPQATYYEDYGNHGDGFSTATKFCVQGFGGVPGLAPDLTILYAFENRGHAGSTEESAQKVLDTVSDLGAGLVTGLMGGGAGWGLVNEAHHQINAAVTAGCDGAVAGDLITAKSDVLARLTAANGTYSETRRYEGTSSPVDCGQVSHYEVTFTFTRVSMPQQAIG
jgi:hypothetical protein